MLAELRQKLGGVRVIIETGRYAVCTAGYYVTKVVDVKESYGTKFVMVQSTLNGFIRPSLARLIAAYLPEGAVAKAMNRSSPRWTPLTSSCSPMRPLRRR